WVGFRQTGVPMRRPARHKGETKYSVRKMVEFAWNGITHFSYLPLHLATAVGAAASAAFFLWSLYLIFTSLLGGEPLSGWEWVLAAVFFFGSVQLLTIGILGSYLARSYDQGRPRPLYVVKETEGLDSPKCRTFESAPISGS